MIEQSDLYLPVRKKHVSACFLGVLYAFMVCTCLFFSTYYELKRSLITAFPPVFYIVFYCEKYLLI